MTSGARCAAWALAIAAGLWLAPADAQAGEGPDACASMSGRFDVPGLWLGHFSGGRWARYRDGQKYVEWRSEYECFASPRACYAWRAQLKRAYRRFDGHGTCLALRGGGRRVAYRVRAIAARY